MSNGNRVCSILQLSLRQAQDRPQGERGGDNHDLGGKWINKRHQNSNNTIG